jgi:hypothetical protein
MYRYGTMIYSYMGLNMYVTNLFALLIFLLPPLDPSLVSSVYMALVYSTMFVQ